VEYEIKTYKAEPQLIAAVRARVPRGGVAQAYRESLDKVWAFLRKHPGLRTDGHNLFLYHHEAAKSGGAKSGAAEYEAAKSDANSGFMTVDFGVQVVRHFDQEGDVRPVGTPGGEVVTMVHRGPYDRLSSAHTAIDDWCRRNGKRIGAFSWEIYGDWTDDPNKLETTVVYLLNV
jgi:effector-binding domain-containing protein